MMDWAAPDYEPTADEIQEFLRAEWLDDAPPGAHGRICVIPTMERFIWELPVFWGNREVDSNGYVVFHWAVLPRCDGCGL